MTTTKRKAYNFNFEGGGWNQVYATNIREARKIAIATYEDREKEYPLIVDTKSFRIAKEEDTNNLMSLFY